VDITRRDFLKASAALASALGLTASGLVSPRRALALEGGVQVVWFQGQGCTGCSVSLLNSIYYLTIDELLVNTVDLQYHPNVMAAAGDAGMEAAREALDNGGYVLAIEGAIPTGSEGKFCYVGEGLTMKDAVAAYSRNAAVILAVGTCAAFGGVSAGSPNPTNALGVEEYLGSDPRLINVPGCPTHPDWVIGTVAYILANGQAPALDDLRRPLDYFEPRNGVHKKCYRKGTEQATRLTDPGCLKENFHCSGPKSKADCSTRKWNSAAHGTFGEYFCIEGGAPCYACTEPAFPDRVTPFIKWEESKGEPRLPGDKKRRDK